MEELLSKLEGGARKGEIKEFRALFDEHSRQVASGVRTYAGLAATGQLAGLVFRQLEHPLKQVRNELQVIADELECAADDPDVIDDLQISAEKSLRLLSSLATRIQKMHPLAAPSRARAVEVDLVECVADVAGIFLPHFSDHSIDFHLDAPTPVTVRTDPAIAGQALALILENAVYWLARSDTPRTLRLSVDEAGITVFNSGPIIAEEHLDRIFEPHFTTRPDAPGLGLTLARDLMRTCNGGIRAERNSEGAQFRIHTIAN